ncbi:MAG: hypothetical protein ACJAVI_004662 [Candidatus Azotimanducaceae bacterium]|jgi:hypothetical protein
MLSIGQTAFDIRVPSLPKDAFKNYSTQLFDIWESEIAQSLSINDYALSLEVEEGSIKGKGKIAVAAGVLYFGIGNYGDFISGLETIYSQVTYVGERLFQAARSPVGGNSTKASKRTSGGAVSSMRRLFEGVQNGSLSVDDAMKEFERMLGEEASENESFTREMRRQLESAPSHPRQLTLPQDDWAEPEVIQVPKKSPSDPRRKPSPAPEQYRIEIWRSSKNERKKVKFTTHSKLP